MYASHQQQQNSLGNAIFERFYSLCPSIQPQLEAFLGIPLSAYHIWRHSLLKQWYCTITNSKLVITNSKLVSKTFTTFSSCQKAQSYCQFFLHGYWIAYLFFDFWHTAWLSGLTPKRKIKIKIKRKTIYWKISSYTHTFNFYIDSDTIKQLLGGTGQARNQGFFSAGRFWPGS